MQPGWICAVRAGTRRVLILWLGLLVVGCQKAVEPTSVPSPSAPVTQLQIFDQATEIVGRCYVDPKFNGRDWPALVARYRKDVERGGMSSEQFFAHTQKLLEELGDGHSRILSPEFAEMRQERKFGSAEGSTAGVLCRTVSAECVAITGFIPGSAAEQAGLELHDSLLSADGKPLVVDGQFDPSPLWGPPGSKVSLKARSPGQKEFRTVEVERRTLPLELPGRSRLLPTTDGSRIGYLFVNAFQDRSSFLGIRKAMENFGVLDGLILDMRCHAGGSQTMMLDVLGFFLPSGEVGRDVTSTSYRPVEVRATPIHNSQSVPLVVLIGPTAVSSGELTPGILQDTGRARLVGLPTPGNVEGTAAFELADGSIVLVPVVTFVPKGAGVSWEGKGVQPDVRVEATWDVVTEEDDPVLKTALELLTR